MATQTTYYEFNKPSGTDLVNPLVDTNPNWDAADAALHELNERSFANATEVVSLGVHAISRINQYTKFIKWIATANYTAGETFTVDGNVVAASTPSGASLATGAYVTGAIVIACLNADDSAMTVFVSGTNVATDSERLGGELPSYYAKQSDMTSAQNDIGNIKALNGNTSIASIGDGTLTGAVNSIHNDVVNSVKVKSIGNNTSFINIYEYPVGTTDFTITEEGDYLLKASVSAPVIQDNSAAVIHKTSNIFLFSVSYRSHYGSTSMLVHLKAGTVLTARRPDANSNVYIYKVN